MQALPAGVKRERDADESKYTGKQLKAVKEEQSGETKVPKIEGQVDEPKSKPNVSDRRLNLMAGRLPWPQCRQQHAQLAIVGRR